MTLFSTPEFEQTVSWLKERRSTKTDGLLSGKSFVGKSFAAKYVAKNIDSVAYALLYSSRTLKESIYSLSGQDPASSQSDGATGNYLQI